MMEYALRVERYVTVTHPFRDHLFSAGFDEVLDSAKQLQQYGAPAAPGKASSIKDEPQNETAPNLKEGSGSNSPHSEGQGLTGPV
jgi:hypothetical protein